MYFVDVNGLIAQVSADGSSNYGMVAGVGVELEIENDHVNVVMPGTGEILDSYQLWDSLASLAAAIDEKPHSNKQGGKHAEDF